MARNLFVSSDVARCPGSVIAGWRRIADYPDFTDELRLGAVVTTRTAVPLPNLRFQKFCG
jgi:hypothetical protein